MASFDPLNARITETVRQSGLKVERLRSCHWVQMFNNMRQKPNSESLNGPTRLMPRLVLVKAEIRITRGLSYI